MSFVTVIDCPLRPLTKGPSNHFFGYFDKTPWSPQTNLLVAHRSPTYDQMPKVGEPVEIGIVGSVASDFVSICTSRAWNFQQGAMCQWISDNSLVFNDIEDGEACAFVVNTDGRIGRKYHRPIAALSPNGQWAASINFGRLTDVKPEYGYAGLQDLFRDERLPSHDGLWHLDLKTGVTRLILSLAQIAAIGSDGDAEGAIHYVNHPLINRSSDRVCFMHRYVNPVGTMQTRFLSCRPDGSEVSVLISGMASHAGWRNGSELLAWAGERAILRSTTKGVARKLPIGNILRRLYRLLGKPAVLKTSIMKDRYILFDHDLGHRKDIARGVLRTDGHCSFSPNGRWFVTDTYPDRNGNASVYVVNWSNQMVIKVRDFMMPLGLDNEVRCDLHPRWHPTKPLICVDSAHGGSRQMYEIDVSAAVRGDWSD